jgi:hypothetical protein
VSHFFLPTAKPVCGIIVREQLELVAQFVGVLRLETTGMNIKEL